MGGTLSAGCREAVAPEFPNSLRNSSSTSRFRASFFASFSSFFESFFEDLRHCLEFSGSEWPPSISRFSPFLAATFVTETDPLSTMERKNLTEPFELISSIASRSSASEDTVTMSPSSSLYWTQNSSEEIENRSETNTLNPENDVSTTSNRLVSSCKVTFTVAPATTHTFTVKTTLSEQKISLQIENCDKTQNIATEERPSYSQYKITSMEAYQP